MYILELNSTISSAFISITQLFLTKFAGFVSDMIIVEHCILDTVCGLTVAERCTVKVFLPCNFTTVSSVLCL